MFKKMVKKIVTRFMMFRGYSKFFAKKVPRELINDFKNTKNLSVKQKIRAYRKGFLSSSILRYELDEKNYKRYIPELPYYKLHPINGKYSHWIDDKMIIKYILQPFSEYLPKYYFEIHKERIIRLMDCTSSYNSSIEGIVDLLRSKNVLALKLISGSKGIGFYKVSYREDEFYINNNKVPIKDLKKLFISLDGYIVTEYIVAHPSIRKVYPVTPNALRVGVFNDGETKIFGAFIRFGSKSTGMIDNASAGGIFCGVDINNGNIFSPKCYSDQKIVDSPIHPDTGVEIKGTVPHWNMIQKVIHQIGSFIPQLKYMGYDIIITENGFKIIEINSHQALTHMQPFYPLLDNQDLKIFFDSVKF